MESAIRHVSTESDVDLEELVRCVTLGKSRMNPNSPESKELKRSSPFLIEQDFNPTNIFLPTTNSHDSDKNSTFPTFSKRNKVDFEYQKDEEKKLDIDNLLAKVTTKPIKPLKINRDPVKVGPIVNPIVKKSVRKRTLYHDANEMLMDVPFSKKLNLSSNTTLETSLIQVPKIILKTKQKERGLDLNNVKDTECPSPKVNKDVDLFLKSTTEKTGLLKKENKVSNSLHATLNSNLEELKITRDKNQVPSSQITLKDQTVCSETQNKEKIIENFTDLQIPHNNITATIQILPNKKTDSEMPEKTIPTLSLLVNNKKSNNEIEQDPTPKQDSLNQKNEIINVDSCGSNQSKNVAVDILPSNLIQPLLNERAVKCPDGNKFLEVQDIIMKQQPTKDTDTINDTRCQKSQDKIINLTKDTVKNSDPENKKVLDMQDINMNQQPCTTTDTISDITITDTSSCPKLQDKVVAVPVDSEPSVQMIKTNLEENKPHDQDDLQCDIVVQVTAFEDQLENDINKPMDSSENKNDSEKIHSDRKPMDSSENKNDSEKIHSDRGPLTIPVLDKSNNNNANESNAKQGRRLRKRKILPPIKVRQTPMGLPKPERLAKKKFSLEEIYTNKNYSTPLPKSLETIFEFPKETKDGSLRYSERRKKIRAMYFNTNPADRTPKQSKKKGVKLKFRATRSNKSNSAESDNKLSTILSTLEQQLKLNNLS